MRHFPCVFFQQSIPYTAEIIANLVWKQYLTFSSKEFWAAQYLHTSKQAKRPFYKYIF